MRHIIRFARDQRGATAIEYGLIAALIALTLVAVLTTLGGNIRNAFSSINTGLGSSS